MEKTVKQRHAALIISMPLFFAASSAFAAEPALIQPEIIAMDAEGNRVPVKISINKQEAPGTASAGVVPAVKPVENTGPPPKMVLPEKEYDAGDVWHGEVVSHEFVIKNSGSGELKILKAKPG